MKNLLKLVFLFAVVLRSMGVAAQDLTVQEWLDLFIDSCVGGGSASFVSGSVDAGLGLSLKKFSANGSVSGQVTLERSSYRLLSEGITDAMSEVTAEQADKVRQCLEPVRRNLLIAMNQQMGTGGMRFPTTTPTIHLLSPFEERVLKVLARNVGLAGETGRLVPTTTVLQETGLSDIRFRVTMRMLEPKWLAIRLDFEGGVNSLTDEGEEYVLEMGYVK